MTMDEDILAAIDASVADLLAAASITEPPVDAVALAERFLGARPARPQAKMWPGRPRPQEPTAEQRQWTAARAAGDYLRPGLLERLSVEDGGLGGAALSNRVAVHLLLPTRWFEQADRECGHDLFALKERFRTAGFETIARRWLDLAEPCVVAVLADGRPRFRRANAGRVPGGLSPAERRCADAVRDADGPQRVRLGAWTVLGWPVGADGVILRSSVDEDGM
jgi:hypothetical protein